MAKYCEEHVSVRLCLFVHEYISGTTHAIFTNFSAHVAYGCGSVLFRQGDEIPRRRGSSDGVFCLNDKALYSIAFGTHAKTAEPIEMPFGMMTQVGRRHHVLDGGPDPSNGKRHFFGKMSKVQ